MILYKELLAFTTSTLQPHYHMLSQIDVMKNYEETVQFIKETDIKAKILSLAFGSVGVVISLYISKSDNIQSPLPYAVIDAVLWSLIGFGVGIIFNPKEHLESLETFNNLKVLPKTPVEQQSNILDDTLELNNNPHNINPEL